MLKHLNSSGKLWKAVQMILPLSTSVQTQLLIENGNEHTTAKSINDCGLLFLRKKL